MNRACRSTACLVLLLVACQCRLGVPAELPAPTHLPLPSATPQQPDPLPSPSPQPAPTGANKRGIHLLLDDGRNAWPVSVWPQHLAYARDLVGEWGYVTELVRLDDLDPLRWQTLFDLCAELHLTPILRLATTYEHDRWVAPPPDPDGGYTNVAGQYARFVAALRWPRAPHYVIIANEPNHGDEWGGQPDPAAYARFLLDTARALRQADPDVRVINGPLDPYTPNTNGLPFVNGMVYLDAESFLDGMVAAHPDVFSAIDVWGSHSYPLGPLTEGPWQQSFQIDLINGAFNPHHVDPPAGVFNRGVNGYEWELFKLQSYGVGDLPVMITETGWRHQESTDAAATDNGRPLPPVATTAEFLHLAFYGNHGRYPQWPDDGWTPWQDDPRVLAVTPFALDGAPWEWGHTNWLQLDSEGNVLGVYPLFEVLAGGEANEE